MKANIVDLRYKMKDVLNALKRGERVEILYCRKPKGVIIPVHESSKKSVKEHPLFGLLANENKSVSQVMKDLRKRRYHAF